MLKLCLVITVKYMQLGQVTWHLLISWISAYNKYDKVMKVSCKKKKKTAVGSNKRNLWKKSHRLPHTQTVTEERVPRFAIYSNSNFGICIEISLLIIFIVKKQKAIIHRNGRKNRKRERFNWEVWYKYVFNNMSLFTKSSDKEKEKKQTKRYCYWTKKSQKREMKIPLSNDKGTENLL